jgi:hypothetical protein
MKRDGQNNCADRKNSIENFRRRRYWCKELFYCYQRA